ncbi:hypothetical protein ABBQ38_007346 [Trebouxia sp. C0009 RCD-2024]
MQRGQNAAHQNQRPDGWRSVEGEKEEERGRRLFVQQGSQAPLPTACTSSDCSVVRSASSDGLRYQRLAPCIQPLWPCECWNDIQ